MMLLINEEEAGFDVDLPFAIFILYMHTVIIGGRSWDSRVQRKTTLSNAYH